MSDLATTELFSIFDARRVKAPELKPLDQFVNGFVGWVKNRVPHLRAIRAQAERINALEPQVRDLGSRAFQEKVAELRVLGRTKKLVDESFDLAMALAREAAVRTLGKRPFLVQLMGALAMCRGSVAEMATGEGKTLTASLTASIWAWGGRPVHVITVNDYLVARDAELMRPVYEMLGLRVGFVTHETSPQ